VIESIVGFDLSASLMFLVPVSTERESVFVGLKNKLRFSKGM